MNEFIHKDLAKFLKENFANGYFKKKVPGWVFSTRPKFIAGLLRAYFDGDGNIHAERQQIRSGSRSEQLTGDISLLLKCFGIYSTMHIETKKSDPTPFYVLAIPRKYAKLFAD